ncbi:hypothetical protein MNV49_005985 [Pseudohyphozyma bogoriensis]|nr:hypothetical protein MNV49_005985 [Pseudohyphozyma bogoriensis]
MSSPPSHSDLLAGHTPAVRIGGVRRSSSSSGNGIPKSPPKHAYGTSPTSNSHGQPAPPAHHEHGNGNEQKRGEEKEGDGYPRPQSHAK